MQAVHLAPSHRRLSTPSPCGLTIHRISGARPFQPEASFFGMLVPSDESCSDWARRSFAHARLGDARRSRRLVALAAAAAASPAGKITQVCASSAERQGAYDWVESKEFSSAQVRQALVDTTVAECAPYGHVFIPLDQTSLVLTDTAKRKDFGGVGRGSRCRGVQVMTALAVSPHGTPIGLCGQSWWARPRRRFSRRALCRGRVPKGPRSRQQRKDLKRRDRLRAVARRNRQRAFEQKETFRWVEVASQLCAAFQGSGTHPWVQCDRGADNQDILCEFAALPMWFTVRSKSNRRLDQGPLLLDHLAAQPVVGRYDVDVPARKNRRARVATMVVRWARVTFAMRHKGTGHQRHLTLWVVQADEVAVPRGHRALRWTLLTNHPVSTGDEACEVLKGYEARWRIEEMHRAWKRGGCHVEDSELHTLERVARWGTVLAAVATRISRLTYLAREKPEQPADLDFSQDEIDAAILLRRPPGWKPGQKPTLGQMVRWVADVGGYTGKSSGGPPGTTVFGRGLERVKTVASGLEGARSLGMTLAPEIR